MTDTGHVANGAGWLMLVGGPEEPVQGHVLLTFRIRRDDDGFYEAECPELGVPSFGETVDEAIANIGDAVVLYLNTLEFHGNRERVFKERGLELRPGSPPEGVEISIPAHPGDVVASRPLLLACVG